MQGIRYGVIGCGHRSKRLVELLAQQPGLELAGAWDPDAQKREAMSPIPLGSYQELLALPNLSWVLVISPNVHHREHIEACLAAGKHVFTEKPLTTTVDDCLALARLVRASDRTVMTGFTLRYSGLYRHVKALIDAGRIGRIVSIDANENLKPGHGAYIFTNWRRDYALAGSNILEKCVHDLDLLNWLTGSLPRRVAAFGGTNLFVPENAHLFDASGQFKVKAAVRASGLNPFTTEKSIEDNLVAILEYESGARAQFQLSSSNPQPERRMYISGTEGNLIFDLVTGTVRLKTLFDEATTAWEQQHWADGHGGGDEIMTTELAATMTQGAAPATGIEEGLKSTLVGLSLDQARREGRVVDLGELWTRLEAP